MSKRPSKKTLSLTFKLALVSLFVFLSGAGASDGPLIREVTEDSGLTFEHWNGRTGALYFPEMTGQGAALFDVDNDGDLDAYLIQGTYLKVSDRGKTLEKAPVDSELVDRLFRNDGVRDGVPRFVDVTAKAKLKADGYGMGVATGDIDGDGFTDLFVANLGANQLWRNRGDGTFEDWTTKAGVAGDPRSWSVGATLADLDRDGHLDLVVIDYVRFDLERNPRCFAGSSRRDYCGPSSFPALPNWFFRNKGDGTFEDWSARSGIGAVIGASLGIVAEDLNDDGWTDLYVANDGEANRLWINQRNGKFEDEGLFAGVALNREGQPEASMGVTVGDVDGDGDADLFMTHLMGETNTLYLNQGGAFFEDRTIEMGLAGGSLSFTSFGTGFIDLNADGWLDLVALSGAVKIQEDLVRKGDPYPLGQANQLFLNRGGRGFIAADDRADAGFRSLEVSRGLALGDVDNDGDVDFLVLNNHGPARLYLVNGAPSRWVGARLLPAAGKAPMGGAQAELRLEGDARPNAVWRRASTDGSYASASDPRVTFALPSGSKVKDLRIHWPDGKKEIYRVESGKYNDLIKGAGAAESRPAAKGKP